MHPNLREDTSLEALVKSESQEEVRELSESQLAFVGGGVGEVIVG